MNNKGIYKDNKMTGPLGMYGIANSQVQTPGYAGLLDPVTGKPMEGGGGGGGFSMGFGGRSSGFGPINLGGGLMDPAQALHEFNMERNKYTPDSPYYQEQAIFSGEKPAQDVYKAAVAAGTNWDKPKGYTPVETKLYNERAKAHTDTQGTIWKGSLGGGNAAKAVKSVSPGWGNSRTSYTAPKAKSSMGSGSSWKRSYSGGF